MRIRQIVAANHIIPNPDTDQDTKIPLYLDESLHKRDAGGDVGNLGLVLIRVSGGRLAQTLVRLSHRTDGVLIPLELIYLHLCTVCRVVNHSSCYNPPSNSLNNNPTTLPSAL